MDRAEEENDDGTILWGRVKDKKKSKEQWKSGKALMVEVVCGIYTD